MEKESEKGADSRRNDIDDDNNQEATAEVLEKGDIFFFYRPKTKIVDDGSGGGVKSIEDIRRFFMVTATTAANAEDGQQQQFDGANSKTLKEESPRYRLFVIGKSHCQRLGLLKQEGQKDIGQRSEVYLKIHRSLQVSCYQMSLGREMLPGLLARENMR